MIIQCNTLPQCNVYSAKFVEKILRSGNILKDADKSHILRVNCTIPLEEIYVILKEKFFTETVSEDVMNWYMLEIPINKKLIKTSVGHIVSQIALAFGLVYQMSIKYYKSKNCGTV